MPASDFDPNPARYLAVYGDDPKFTAALRDLVETDMGIGEINSVPSNSIMVRYLNILLSQRENQIQDRILLIQERDVAIQKRDIELRRLIDEIHRIYSSKRYRMGHLMISPFESTISRLRRK